MTTIILFAIGALVVSVGLLAWALCAASARAEEMAVKMWSHDGSAEAIERCYLCGTSLGWKPETLIDPMATCEKCATIVKGVR